MINEPWKAAGLTKSTYYRHRKVEAKAAQLPLPAVALPWPRDPAGALAAWCRDVLKVPAGHARAGEPMTLPDYGVAFLADALVHRESFLCIGRKNAKSAIVAAYLLARLVGPLRTAGYRAGVCSVNREKAGELKTQMEQIAEASGLDGLVWKRSPAPGRVESSTGAVDVLCADRSAGHASGFDDAIVDELGLFQEKDRALVNGMRSSTSAKDGRFIALSIQGDAPFTKELIERADDPAVAVHLYRSPEGCTLDDPEAWAAANPGIAAGIKSSRYMEDEARRVLLTPADQGSFRAFDLNQPQAPGREMVCQVTDWQALPAPAERSGACVVGFDIGESASMSGFVACWPDTGRMEVFGAFADTPSLAERGMADGAGNLYVQMHDRGELRTYSGRVVPPGEFLKDCAARLAGVQVLAAGADRFRRDAVMTALDAAGIRWPMAWRGQGASATADGSSDVRAFQTWVLTGRLRPVESLVMASAIKESAIYRDRLGNPALHKARTRGRIDALSAGVIAVGLAERQRPQRAGWRYLGAAG